MISAYLDGKAQVYICTGSQTVCGAVGALRGKTYIVIDELTPVHQHVRVDILLCCCCRAPY